MQRNVFKEDTDPIAHIVLKIIDKSTITPPSIPDGMNWLWGFHGELLIISTPYHEGVHYATRPFHFLPIINHLAQLHSQGFVHGDIRAYNMVLQYDIASSEPDLGAMDTAGRSSPTNNDCKGWLIDFDFGGKHGTVTYPMGYEHLLHDGSRPGSKGNKITIMDDWISLISLIRRSYFFVTIEGAERKFVERMEYLEYRGLLCEKESELEKYCNETVKDNDPLRCSYEIPAQLLRDYIDLSSKISNVRPNPTFLSDLKNVVCGWQRIINGKCRKPLLQALHQNNKRQSATKCTRNN